MMPATDPLAVALREAATKLAKRGDVEMLNSFLRQHENGKQLSTKQMYWAKTLIARAGITFNADFDKKNNTVENDIFAEPAAVEKMEEAIKDVLADTDPLKVAAETNAEALEGLIAKVLEPRAQRIETTLDELSQKRQEAFNKNAAKAIAEQCVVEAMKCLDARVPRTVNIIVKRDGVSHTVEGIQHPNFEKLLKHCTLRKPDGYVPGIFLAGERGSGKTTGCRNAAKVLGLTWYSNGAISDPIEMLGYCDGNGNYHRTPFRDAFERGGLYTYDEVDRSDPNATLAVNPHLANNEAAFPDGMVKRHPDCIITATGNTWGLGGSLEFAGANKLDEAFLSRFEVKLPWDVDLQFERKIVGNDAWMNYVQQARQRVKEAGIKYTIDSRAALAGAAMIAQLGYTFEQAAGDTFLASMKPDQRQIVMGVRS